MTPDIPDEFIDLFESLCEGTLDGPGHERLVIMLRDNPELLAEVRGHLEVSGLLADVGRDDDALVQRTAAHVIKMAGEAEDTFARRVTRRIVQRRVVRALAVAAVVALALLPALLRRGGDSAAPSAAANVPGEVVARLERMDAAGEIVGREEVRAGSRLREETGWIRMEFGNGAAIAVEAPANLTVVSGMEVALESGRLNGWCPESAHGFRVTTGSASLTDLGTSFGVNAGAGGSAKFMVLDGHVEVEHAGRKRRLGMGDAVETTLAEPLRDVVFDPAGFHKTWALSHGILATRGALMPVRPDIPENLVGVENDTHVLVIPERRDVPFERPIHAEIVAPGTLPGDFDGRLHVLEPQPGKRLGSYLIRYNPVGVFSEEHFLKFEGEVTFDRPVIAIACKLEALELTDPAFTIGQWGGIYRGVEIEQLLNPPDTVTLSEDRRTVRVRFYAGASTDDVRVIVEED